MLGMEEKSSGSVNKMQCTEKKCGEKIFRMQTGGEKRRREESVRSDLQGPASKKGKWNESARVQSKEADPRQLWTSLNCTALSTVDLSMLSSCFCSG